MNITQKSIIRNLKGDITALESDINLLKGYTEYPYHTELQAYKRWITELEAERDKLSEKLVELSEKL